MTIDDARKALMSVLKNIQDRSGLPCPTLTGSTVPTKVLEKFDSTVWPAAITLVARELGVVIPHDVHIFGDKGGKLLSIDQAAEVICNKSESKTPVKVAA